LKQQPKEIIKSYRESLVNLATNTRETERGIIVWGNGNGKTFQTVDVLENTLHWSESQEYEIVNSLAIDNKKEMRSELCWYLNKFRNREIIVFDMDHLINKLLIPELIEYFTADRRGYTNRKAKTFIEINARLVFVSRNRGEELENFCPVFNFNFDSIGLLEYMRDTIDVAINRYQDYGLTKEDGILAVDFLRVLIDKKIIKSLNYFLLHTVLSERILYNEKKVGIPYYQYLIHRILYHGDFLLAISDNLRSGSADFPEEKGSIFWYDGLRSRMLEAFK
jgi:hypothetical protein